MSDTPHIGFIGLGVMGSRMATTLARAGYALDVFDVDPAKTRRADRGRGHRGHLAAGGCRSGATSSSRACRGPRR